VNELRRAESASKGALVSEGRLEGTHLYVFLFIHILLHMYIHVHICIYAYVYIHNIIYVYIYIYKYVFLHTYIQYMQIYINQYLVTGTTFINELLFE
jgi:hypothetical protein